VSKPRGVISSTCHMIDNILTVFMTDSLYITIFTVDSDFNVVLNGDRIAVGNNLYVVNIYIDTYNK
jgi:hypothetical protein